MQEPRVDDGVWIIQRENSDPPQFLSTHDVWATIATAATFDTEQAAQAVIEAGRCPDGSKGLVSHYFEFKISGGVTGSLA
jgi:hypothetical protein